MRRMWPVAVVVLGFAALGVANALKAPVGRSAAAVETQARLDTFPRTLGPWAGTDSPVPEKQLQIAQAQAHLSRVYTRENPATSVSTLLLYGEPGQLGAHTPQVCFAGAGYKQVERETRITVAPGAEFWTAKFETSSLPPSTMQVVWGWGADGEWKASDNPRLDFAGRSAIFKLYVSRAVPAAARPGAADPLPEFTAAFARELQETFTRPAASPAAADPK